MGIQYDNPYEAGMTGLLGLPSAFQSMHESDLILLLNLKEDDSFLKAQLLIYDKVKEHLNIYVSDKGKKNAIHHEAVAYELNKLATDDAIFTVDTGMCCVWGARYIHAAGKRNMLIHKWFNGKCFATCHWRSAGLSRSPDYCHVRRWRDIHASGRPGYN